MAIFEKVGLVEAVELVPVVSCLFLVLLWKKDMERMEDEKKGREQR